MFPRALTALSAAAAFACASIAFTQDASAAITVNGYVTCIDQESVVGVWIQADGGSGWASRSGSGYQQYFSKGGVTGKWTVHVGCGGTSSSWRYSANGNTTVTNSTQSWTCYTADIVTYPFCQKG
jgi:hypothetical protein